VRARQFFHASAGVLMLMVAVLIGFHLGQSKAEAQGVGESTGVSGDSNGIYTAITSSGDVYCRRASVYCTASGLAFQNTHSSYLGWRFVGYVLGGGPVPAEKGTFGAIKETFR
jgi:hypothetical protein